MTHFIARTIASGDAMHDCAVFVINDAGTWMLKRPQDYPRQEIPELIRTAHEKRLIDLYQKARVEIADDRINVPRQVPFVAPFNKWMTNVPGTTYFLPVAELTALYINVMLSIFDDDFATFVVDDRNGYQPAGIAAFARSAGGTLHGDPADGRVLTVSFVETWICEFVAIEQGAIHQNLGLMCAALGLGGFPHFAAHPFIWPLALGFRTENVPFNRLIGLPSGASDDLPVPTPVGLERNGEVLLKPFCPPYYRNMEEAVSGVSRLQIRGRTGHISRWRRRNRLAGRCNGPGSDPSLLHQGHRRDDCLLPVRVRTLRTIPCQQRTVPYRSCLPSPSARSGLLCALLSRRGCRPDTLNPW